MLEAVVNLEPWRKSVEIALVEATSTGFRCAENLVLVDRREGEMVTPCVSLEPKAVQQLMDDLWRCGFRPSQGEGSAGQLASVKYHLEDMRRLVFQDKG